MDISHSYISAFHLGVGADRSNKLISDFTAARVHLDRAANSLRGNDEVSCKTREAIDLLVEAVTLAEHSRPSATILDFKHTEFRSGSRS